MSIKIDLEKAYDCLNWAFIRDALQDIGYPKNFVNIIWHFISSSKIRMFWNSEPLEEFRLEKGVRQGDPISPYLFVLCIERLFH